MRIRSIAALCLVAGASVVAACSSSDDASEAADGGAVVSGEDASSPDGAPPATRDAARDAAEAGPPPCGRNTTLCADGEACAGAPDCASRVCRDGVCRKAAPGDGVKNGDETDVDCGGKAAPACADGKACLVKDDCQSGVCTNHVCQAPTPTDGVKNGDETDVDCGGTKAPPCAVGKGCKSDGDCDRVRCDPATKTCAPPSHTDGLKNGDETGVDCGGPTAPSRCLPGQGCVSNADCANVACDVAGAKLCLPPSASDGIENGTETDVDCGGGAPTNAPACAAGKTCAVNADCASSGCNYAKRCVEARSCVSHFGGDTCGAAGNESCCASLPAGAAVIDKYNITAGRMRAFVNATGGNLRGYIQANAPAWWNAAWTSFLPTMLDNGGTTPDDAPAYSGVYQELGPYTHGKFGPTNEGCYVNGIGARTFRLPDAVNARMNDAQQYPQDFLDQRALNCVTVYMIAAFCAWDGARLPTRQELDVAWGNAKYPWGAQAPAGYDNAYVTDPMGLSGREAYGAFQTAPFVDAPFPLTDVARANYNYDFWGGASRVGSDYSIYVAPPGRFPSGNGPFGHADLAGSVFNAVDITGTSTYWSRSGSWQGHNIPWKPAGTWSSFPASNKYWAMGGRCAR